MKYIIVPLNAFNKEEVLKQGQKSFIRTIAESEANGVEIRRELLTNGNQELDDLGLEIKKYGLFTVYSAPVELWKIDYSLNLDELACIFKEGMHLNAKWIKVSLGHFDKQYSSMEDLRSLLSDFENLYLLVENDQTPYGGNIKNLKSFFEVVTDIRLPIKMTFDVGNWAYCGENMEACLKLLEPYIGYLHLKQVERQGQSFVTVPLQREGNMGWKLAIQKLPQEIAVALEFPIEFPGMISGYINFILEASEESEGLPCQSLM